MTVMHNNFFPGELIPNAVIAGCIAVYENVWPDPYQTIAMVENEITKQDSEIYFQRAETTDNGAYQEYRTNKMMGVTHLAGVQNNALMQNIHNQFYMLLLAATIPYAKMYGINENLYHEHYQLLKYSEGEQYKAHYDSGTRMGRAISCLCYLNNDYGGGQLEFPNFKIKITPEPGMLLLFPSNFAYMHQAHPVTNGTKYTMVTWLKDREM